MSCSLYEPSLWDSMRGKAVRLEGTKSGPKFCLVVKQIHSTDWSQRQSEAIQFAGFKSLHVNCEQTTRYL
uniref:Uncharacterized protein n=1 Tax=Rhizophora mucronata TaxID=61149 RepID=A0A2P2P8R0_RHIMU